MAEAPRAPFEQEMAEFFGEAMPADAAPRLDHVTFQPADPAAARPL